MSVGKEVEVRRFPATVPAAAACGDQILLWLTRALAERESATLAVSGGSSPRPMFEMFARVSFPWERVHVFFVDERCVPPTDSQSNFKFVDDVWLAPARVPAANVHRVLTELGPQQAAQKFAAELEDCFALAPGQLPRFDAVHLGMGPDAHTASLFPGEPSIADRTGLTAALYVEKFQQWRVTLLPGALLAARHTAVLAAGEDKAPAFDAVFNGPYDPSKWPAQIAAREESGALLGPTVWFVTH